MSLSDRRVQIGSYLGIKPITHGQIYTFQIAIPNAETIAIPLERRELLAQTLKEHQSNLVSLVVRRTQAYDEEKEYEIVYGADWCIVAQELEIERLWVWVFDLTDEQAITMKTELEQLLGGDFIPPINPDISRQDEQPLELQLTQQLPKLMELYKRSHEETQAKFQTLSQMISSETTQINNRLQQLENTVKLLTDNLDKLITQFVEKPIVTPPPRELDYSDMTVAQLKKIAKQRKIKGYSSMKKDQLIAILSQD